MVMVVRGPPGFCQRAPEHLWLQCSSPPSGNDRMNLLSSSKYKNFTELFEFLFYIHQTLNSVLLKVKIVIFCSLIQIIQKKPFLVLFFFKLHHKNFFLLKLFKSFWIAFFFYLNLLIVGIFSIYKTCSFLQQ